MNCRKSAYLGRTLIPWNLVNGSSYNATTVLSKIKRIKINITCNQNMWHDMAIIFLCSWSPSPKHRHDLQRHRRNTLISIVASLSSCQLMLLRLSLSFSDKVKQSHGDCIAYNKAATIWLLPVADNFVTKHDRLIQQFISHHALTISHHNKPCKNKLDVLYFVVASFTWLLRAEQEPFLPMHQNHNDSSSS